jgi:hypothetical protein
MHGPFPVEGVVPDAFASAPFVLKMSSLFNDFFYDFFTGQFPTAGYNCRKIKSKNIPGQLSLNMKRNIYEM